jgi:glutaredoxin
MTSPSHDVVVYTQPGCAHCVTVKQFLVRHGVPYTERDVARDDRAFRELIDLGYRSTPVTTVDGAVVVGSDRAELARLLAIGTPGAPRAREGVRP